MNTDVKKWTEEDGAVFLKEIGLKKGQIVLDFGCGEGHYTIPAAAVVERDGKVYALDKDRDALDKLEKAIEQNKIENIKLIENSSKIPLKDNSVDVVLCYDVIHYANREERKAIYDGIYRVLKKQGFFSVYPKHHREDQPLMELANIELGRVIEEIEKVGFNLEHKFLKTLLHDEHYNKGYILNFRR